MKFRVNGEMEYEVSSPGTLILSVHALKTNDQRILEETFTTEPSLKADELTTLHGENRLIRLDIPETGTFKISYNALVDNSFTLIEKEFLDDVPIMELDSSVLPYLYPSRYCQSDKLYRLANNKFGEIENPYEKVVALTEWIQQNVEYLSGSTNSHTSAYDTVTEQAGVCRDFAHLGIALCRALTIPARYFTGYAYMLNPPDFHACFEAYLGGKWIIFDATKLIPLNGLVKIATGRDAADTAIASMFGNIICTSISVSCNPSDIFKPYYYDPTGSKGLSYS